MKKQIPIEIKKWDHIISKYYLREDKKLFSIKYLDSNENDSIEMLDLYINIISELNLMDKKLEISNNLNEI